MIELITLVSLLALGYIFGQRAEKKHFKSIIAREKLAINIPIVTLKTPPPMRHDHMHTELVSGNVVISIDFFKKFVASLKMLFGGKITPYESLLDRARREALLRMKEQAQTSNAFVVMNARVETPSISKNSRQKNSVGPLKY